jgi:hypothetical protein
MEKKPVTELINAMRPRKALADEIGASVEQVHKWAQFGRIPSEWQLSVIQAASRRGLSEIDAAWMLNAHDRERGAA